MTHPLTDEVCNSIAPWSVQSPCGHTNMRAAADWQLEQVIKFMKEHEKMFGGSGMIFILEDAMRPLTDN